MVLLGLVYGGNGVIACGGGDAKRSMWVTLGGGLATAFLDPLFIFVFQMGLDGAAIVTNISRVFFVMIGAYGVITVHKLFKLPTFAELKPILATQCHSLASHHDQPCNTCRKWIYDRSDCALW